MRALQEETERRLQNAIKERDDLVGGRAGEVGSWGEGLGGTQRRKTEREEIGLLWPNNPRYSGKGQLAQGTLSHCTSEEMALLPLRRIPTE